MSGGRIRCKKCSRRLFSTDQCHLYNGHGIEINVDEPVAGACIKSCSIIEDKSLIYISEEEMPEFIFSAVMESSWTKGKLNCPHCKGRLGSFNFISGAHCNCGQTVVPPIHFLQSKIDYIPSNDALFCPVSYPGVLVAEEASGMDKSENGNEVFLNDAGTDKNEMESSVESLAAPENSKDAETGKEKSDTDSEKFPDYLLCPICLDLLYSPFSVKPCDHIFCEPCLRRLGRPCPVNVLCPLCRSHITLCLPCPEYSKEVKTVYFKRYNERQKMERDCNDPITALPYSARCRSLERRFAHVYNTGWGGWRTVMYLVAIDLFAMIMLLIMNWILSSHEQSEEISKLKEHIMGEVEPFINSSPVTTEKDSFLNMLFNRENIQ